MVESNTMFRKASRVASALVVLALPFVLPIRAAGSENGSQNAEVWTETTTVNGRTASVTYTRASRSIVSTSPEGRQSTTLLDSFGRPIEERVPGIESVRTSYDDRGRVERVEQGAVGAARTSAYAYDSQGYLASVTDPLLRTVQLRHDAVGRITKQVLPDLREIDFTYDASGNLTSVTPPSRPSHGFAYSSVDQLDTYTPPDVVIGTDATSYSYNRDRQLTQVRRPDGQTLDLGYDFAGRPSTLATPSGVTTYNYNGTTGHLDSIGAPAGGGSVAYQRDGPLITGITQGGPVPAQVAYTYDRAPDNSSNFWIVARTIDGNGATAIAYEYDDDGLMTRAGPLQLHRDPANGLLAGTTLAKTGDRIERTSFGEVQRFQAGFDDLSCGVSPPPTPGCRVVLDQRFVRDAAGRITRKTETLRDPIGNQPAETRTYDYTFDPAGRLTEVQRDGAVWETYGYDANSNRTTWTDPWGTGAAAYDMQDRLLTYGNRAYTYTPNGELLTKTQGGQTVTYTYDVLGNLKTVALPTGITIDYVVDVHNRRIGKKVNGSLVQRFVYGTGIAPLVEQDSGGILIATFVYGSKGNVPDLMLRDGKSYRIVADHLGSVRWVLDAETGVVAQRLDYDVFGRVLLDSNPGFQPFGFAGGLYDHQTGLVRYGARDYDSEVGRWTAKDPIGFAGGSAALYEYVANDPVNRVDLSGLESGYVTNYGVTTANANIPITRPELYVWGSLTAIAAAPAAAAAWGVCLVNAPTCSTLGVVAAEAMLPAGSSVGPRAVVDGATLAGYRSFRAAKAALGSPGAGRVFDHVVEQSQIARSGFAPDVIHQPVKLNPVRASVNQAKADYYSSKRLFTGGQTVRDWLTNQSFRDQYEFGLETSWRIENGIPPR